MTHKRWQDLLPFYVTGTLSRQDALALERHLMDCRTCRKTLDEWRGIAGAVRDEASTWAQAAPPLSPRVRASLYAGGATSSNGYRQYPPAWSLEQTLYRQKPVGSHAAARRLHLPVTLAAAAMVILAFGVLLLYIASRDRPPSPLSQPGLPITPSLSRTPAPSGTMITSPAAIPQSVEPVSTEPQDLGILPVLSPTPTTSTPGPTPMSPAATSRVASPPAYQCSAGSAMGAAVTLFNQPDAASGTGGVLYPGAFFQVIAKSGDGWYQLAGPGGYTAGWAPGYLVTVYGPCSTLPVATPVPPTATPLPTLMYGDSIGMGYVLVTTEPIGDMPAGTRVRISHAQFNDSQWQYYVVAEDEQTMAWATASQLTYAPNMTPGPTPTALYGSSIGMGYALITTEPVGPIPAGAQVRIGSAWFDGTDWVYSIVAEDGQTTADARQWQLTYAPPPAPTPTFTLTGG
jgi:hypothetical protein